MNSWRRTTDDQDGHAETEHLLGAQVEELLQINTTEGKFAKSSLLCVSHLKHKS